MIDLENGLIAVGVLCLLAAAGVIWGWLGLLVGLGITALVAGVLVGLWQRTK